jgi:hypothetical protein
MVGGGRWQSGTDAIASKRAAMRFQRSPEVTFEVLNGHAVLIDPGAVEMLTLNRVGTLVWEHLGVPRTREELVGELLLLVSGADEAQVTADITTFLDELIDSGLVVTTDA